MKKTVAQVEVGLPLEGPFDYSVRKSLHGRIAAGDRVKVLFNRKIRIGYVTGFKAKSSFPRLNPILEVLDESPVLNDEALRLSTMIRDYYGCSKGEAIEVMLPQALTRNLKLRMSARSTIKQKKTRENFKPVLVHDPDRQQGWPYCRERVQKAVANKQGVIVVVPESGMISRVIKALGENIKTPVFIRDRALTPKQEALQWEQIRSSDAGAIVIGTRSTVFAPVSPLGLIIVCDEENPFYKEEQVPYYRVPYIAQMRAELAGASLILMSAAPSAETWQQAKQKKWERANFISAPPSEVQIVDMTNYNPQKTSILSFPLQNAIQKTLEEEGGRVILFMNRKGFSTRTRCQQCNYTMKCPRCDVNLTFRYTKKALVCRHCGTTQDLPKVCPECKGAYLKSTGRGIEKLESEAARLYPFARICHYDKDTTAALKDAQIIIATQAVFRLEEEAVADLVAVLNFDAELYHLDVRCAQRAFGLLVRLRHLATKKLLIQTRMIDNYSLVAAQKMDFNKYYRQELKLRRELGFPPFNHLVAIGIRGRDESFVFDQSQELYSLLEKEAPDSIEVSETHPGVLPKLRDKYRFTIILKGKDVRRILSFVKGILKKFKKRRDLIVTVNVDP